MRPLILKSFLLSQFKEIVHGVSTKVGPLNDFNFNLGNTIDANKDIIRTNRKIFFNSLDVDESRVVFQQQVHSNNICFVDSPQFIKENDALITNQKNLFLVVTVADCIPILFYDEKTKIVGVVHAGWRGTKSEILKITMEYALEKFNPSREKTYFYFGPSICSNCFEVDEDVASQFNSKFVRKKERKFTIDLPQVNLQFLIDLGFKKSNIQISNLCTFELKNLFHSYRRDKEKSGRMLGVIGIK